MSDNASKLSLPDGNGGFMPPGQVASQALNQTDLQIGWTQDDVPKPLQDDLELNPKLFPKYVEAVKKAIQLSLNHPLTKPRVLTVAVMKERLQACHKALLVMREEQGMALTHCFGMLPEKFIDALIRDERAEDLADQGRRKETDLGDGVTGESWSRKMSEERLFIKEDLEKQDRAPKVDLKQAAKEE